MIIAFYAAQSYDRTYFDRFSATHTLHYLDTRLNEQTVGLCAGSDAVCLFVNDHASGDTIRQRLIRKTCSHRIFPIPSFPMN